MEKTLRQQLEECADPEYRAFNERIVGTGYPMLGVRMGDCRRIAHAAWDPEPPQSGTPYYEEVLVHGLRLAAEKSGFEEKWGRIKDYIGLIDSWVLCDSVCSSFRLEKDELEGVFLRLEGLLAKDDEYSQRFALVMMLTHFIKLDPGLNKVARPKRLGLEQSDFNQDLAYFTRVLEAFDRPYRHKAASQAAAWLGAEMFTVSPAPILKFLGSNHLDDGTHNLLISKITDSRVPDRELKALARGYRRKRQGRVAAN